jgi:hypothetical protein
MDAAFRAVQRYVSERVPDARIPADDGASSLELRRTPDEPPRLTPASVLEGHAIRAVRVDGDPTPGFGAFLDGTQRSDVLCYLDGLPVVGATVASVVRLRVNRRLSTWPRGPRIERSLYAPLAYLSPTTGEALARASAAKSMALVDTTAAAREEDRPSPHPQALLERALGFVQHDRELLEKGLAEEWCRFEHGSIFIDGSVQESDLVASAACTVGVIKSHRTLYVNLADLRIVLGLRRAQRSSVFRIASSRRTPVASWYLRLRDPSGHDPMWGLVRVEAADLSARGERREDLTARADRISRWILAEATPLALPDGRWDKMVYGIRDCEEFLRAVC